MSDKPHTDKSSSELRDRVWQLAASIGTCMLVTWDGERQQARPMAATLKRDEHAIYFLTDKRYGKGRRGAQNFPRVTLAFADTSGNKYVAISGLVSVGQDRAKIKELWSSAAKAWWDSADDPSIRVLTVTPDEAELWDSPNKLIATAVMLTAAATGNRPSLGDNARVSIKDSRAGPVAVHKRWTGPTLHSRAGFIKITVTHIGRCRKPPAPADGRFCSCGETR